MWAKAKMGARDEVMKNEPKSLKLVKEPCMQCLFAVRPERWRRFRGMVCIGKGGKKEEVENVEKCEEISPLQSCEAV